MADSSTQRLIVGAVAVGILATVFLVGRVAFNADRVATNTGRIALTAAAQADTCRRINDLTALLRTIIARSESQLRLDYEEGVISRKRYLRRLASSRQAQDDLRPVVCEVAQ